MNATLRMAAAWMVRNNYQADPERWVKEAATRYDLTEQQQAILLFNASR